MSNLTKKEIIESLKALEINYKPTQSVSELRKLLDKAMGVVVDDKVDAGPVELSKPEDKPKPKQENKSEGISDRSVTFADISAYNRKMALKKLGK